MKIKKMLILICSGVLMIGAFTACSPSKEKEATLTEAIEATAPESGGENEEKTDSEEDVKGTVGTTMQPATEVKSE